MFVNVCAIVFPLLALAPVTLGSCATFHAKVVPATLDDKLNPVVPDPQKLEELGVIVKDGFGLTVIVAVIETPAHEFADEVIV